ncbi:MAG TPA: PSD1 and planctomycete cytochrome C domain-containing protein [Pyrinomonadaceae bacterium]
MKTRVDILAACVIVAAAIAFVPALAADVHSEKMAQSLTLFKTDVRAVLTNNCVQCHGGEKVLSGFDLTTREGLLAGGVGGVSVIAGNAKESRIIDYLAHRKWPYMPAEKPRLSDDTISKIARWIDLGAAYDKPLIDRAQKRALPLQVTRANRDYWAYAPLKKNFSKDAGIDNFIRAKQKEKHLTAAPQASSSTLIRRLYFDVTGLPPEPAAINAFLTDKSPSAYEALVDQLLASPYFGEHWARRWLDIARFAESHGFEHDYNRPYAFHYRDFVIRAFNQDMPYDQFVRWQLAGDELAPDNPLALMATGFLGAGVHPTQITISDAERIRYDSMDDMLATTGSAMLATTVGCARCHDHKYDPIPTSDYYRMLSAFTTTVRAEVDVDLGSLDQGSAAPKPSLQKVMISSEGEHIRPQRFNTSSDQIPDFYKETYYLDRGDPGQKAGVAELGFLQVLTRTQDKNRWTNKSRDKRTSGRRAALSYWITDVEYGAGHLLARVIVNRLWQHYFGRGIVATANDFGTQCDQPTHPELLDWLATELIRNGWRLKPIHKLILMSETYRMGQRSSIEDEKIDPENRFLWRRRPRRLEAEAIRDNALAVGGVLDKTMFGTGTLDEKMRRRSIYFTVKRSQLVASMQMFDWPDTLTSMDRRAITTSPAQALVFINDPQFRQMAEGFAGRIMSEEDRIGAAYLIAYGRPPSGKERTLGEEFVQKQLQSHNGDLRKTLSDFCAALMSTNEFIYIE